MVVGKVQIVFSGASECQVDVDNRYLPHDSNKLIIYAADFVA